MRKTERLDQILIRLGYVTQSQVQEAVSRQASSGGRIGQNLIEIGALTEEQLFDGLVEQFRVPTVAVDEHTVDKSLLGRMPADVLERSLIMPVSWNEKLGVLSIAVANPSDEAGIARVKAAFGAKKVRVSLAPETLLADLIMRLHGGGGVATGPDDTVRLVALPELFEPGEVEEAAPEVQPEVGNQADRVVVMVATGPSRKNFLPAVLRAEGFDLEVVSAVEDLPDALKKQPEVVLVAADMEEIWRGWIATGAIHAPECEVQFFTSVADALMLNPAPYAQTAASVRASAGAIAEYRALAEGVSPPYTLMATDLEALAERLGLGRLARDGLHVALHLLTPVEAGTSIDPFRAFAATMELAHRIRFPWPVDDVLSRTLGLYLGRVDAGDAKADEVALGAQVLALVWFRHNLAEGPSEPSAGVGDEPTEETEAKVRAALRSLAGRFAPLDVIEAYVEILTERASDESAERCTMLVGGERIARALGPALSRVGSAVVHVESGTDAQTSIQEVRPDAVVIDHEAFGADLEKISRVLRQDRGTLVFVLSDEADPALVLNLLDIGIDDVFGPPHDFDLVAARILRAMRARATVPKTEAPQGDFAARFEAFSFLDLAQMLANGMKSVRVDLRRGSGEEAVLYVQNGRPVHATCGALTGPQAVYYVISWEDDGEFAVNEEASFPDANLAESIESLLMEGVRLLDESRA
ncbi:MAG: DUF4388 domain-containing protein [Gemmatimonadota bacterium]